MKKYKINDEIIEAENEIEAVKKYKEMASDYQTIEALKIDEESAVASYKVAIENLQGRLSPKAIEILQHILKEELEHIEELNQILYRREESVETEDCSK